MFDMNSIARSSGT